MKEQKTVNMTIVHDSEVQIIFVEYNMTRTQSLQKALQLWEFLEINPDIHTKDQAYMILGLTHDKFFCPFCQYTFMTLNFGNYKSQDGGVVCEYCPAIEEWEKLNPKWSPDVYGVACEEYSNYPIKRNHTPWQKWKYALDSEERRKYAAEMVELIKRAIKRHNER